MTYNDLRQLTLGKEFIRKQDARVFTRTAFYFEASASEISNLMNGYEGTWIMKDKRFWKDGVYHEPKRREKEENLYE